MDSVTSRDNPPSIHPIRARAQDMMTTTSGPQAKPLPNLEEAQALLDQMIEAVRSTTEGRQLLESMSPEQVETDYERAWQMMASGDMDGATEAFGDLARRAPDQHRVQFAFALCLQHHGLVDDALRHYGLAFVLDPSSAACAFRMGECLLARGDTEDAREALLTAIELAAIEGNDPQIRIYAQEALDTWASGAPSR